MRYLVHYFDAHEHLRRSEVLFCADDLQAIAQAAARAHPNVLEIWLGDRRVWRDDRAAGYALAS